MNNRLKISMLSAVSAAILCSSCSRELPIDESAPLEIKAEIISSDAVSRAVITGYEREGSFISGDQIRVTKTLAGSADQSVDYSTGDGSNWDVLAGVSGLTLTSGATYSARYPAHYTAIAQDQSSAASYLASDLLVAPQTGSMDGMVKFTEANKFVHGNAKISFVFVAPSGSSLENSISFRITAVGLRSGGAGEESIIMLRPDTDQLLWCGIAYPQAAEKTIKVSLTYKGVDYTTNLSCDFQSGSHYRYTLTIHNNILMPQMPDGSAEIVGWNDNVVYTGGFTS